MKRLTFRCAAICVSLAALFGVSPNRARAQHVQPRVHRLTTTPQSFLLDGKPFQIISGEMHYARIPRAYWRDRLRKARAMGLNTISTYVFWNLHEPRPGTYDFSGEKNVAEFIRTAQQEGLWVILRPGPYVCAEWELGGYPAWLFADSVVLRSTDPHFTVPAAKWLDRLGNELSPLLAAHGGPIIAVQVENEYGSFGKDKNYLEWQLAALRHAGFGDALLYTADGDTELPNGTLPQLPAVVNFGPGEAAKSFAALHAFRPDEPLMSGEYWAGWFDQWGKPHQTTDAAIQTRELDWMLAHGYSVNLYMFHGGTTFGFMNGANSNSNGEHYLPQTTSYDYDAALDEAGHPTPKYFAFRDVMAKYRAGVRFASVPPAVPLISISPFQLPRFSSIWNNIGTPVRVQHPRSMETFGQSYGYILYRTTLTGPFTGELVVKDVRDYAQIYVDAELAGTLDRRLAQDSLRLVVPPGSMRLDILVENTGRVNFTKALRNERKGITRSVTLAGHELTGWEVFPMPMSNVDRIHFARGAGTGAPRDAISGAGFHNGTFHIATTGDSYLDMRGWGKGIVWVNGHNLGRFWSIGPQQTLYLPEPWLHRGSNDITVFDLETPSHTSIGGITTPVFTTPH